MDYNSGKYLKLSELITGDTALTDLIYHVPTINDLTPGNTSSYVFQSSAVTIHDDVINAKNTDLRYLTLRHNVTDLPTGSPTKCYIWYGVCATAAATATKVVNIYTDDGTISAGEHSAIQQKGSILFVTFIYTNTQTPANLKLSINGNTAVPLQKIKNNAVGNLQSAGELQAGCTYMFVYNGSVWVCMTVDYNSTYANYSHGNGFATDSRTSAVTAITATYANYALSANGRVSVLMKYTNNASATLKIGSAAAKDIKYYNSSGTLTNIQASVIPAYSIAEFIYDGTQYIYLGYYKYGETSGGVTVNNGGTSTTQYYLMGTPSTIGTTLYRYGTSGPYMVGNQLYAGSDLAYKKDITPISGTFVDELFSRDDITYDFTWKDSNSNSSGFIAQWIEDIMPEVVNGEDGEKHVNYDAALSKVVGAMFKKIQEQQNQIDELIKQNKEIKQELENIRNTSEK